MFLSLRVWHQKLAAFWYNENFDLYSTATYKFHRFQFRVPITQKSNCEEQLLQLHTVLCSTLKSSLRKKLMIRKRAFCWERKLCFAFAQDRRRGRATKKRRAHSHVFHYLVYRVGTNITSVPHSLTASRLQQGRELSRYLVKRGCYARGLTYLSDESKSLRFLLREE